MAQFDRSSKWMIEFHDDVLLLLAGLGKALSWRPLPAEVVQTGQLPDGILEAHFAGESAPEPVVLEIATYPEQRLLRQLRRDALLINLNRDEQPEVVAVILRPRGRLRIPEGVEMRSRRGTSRLRLSWRVVELWRVPAELLLASGDPGAMPWVPLCAFEGEPEPLLRQCAGIIRTRAPEGEQSNLLAVAQILASLRYNNPGLLSVLGGHATMIESPLLAQIQAESEARGEARGEAHGRVALLLTVLGARFGPLPEQLEARLRDLQEPERLEELARFAVRCPDLARFEAAL